MSRRIIFGIVSFVGIGLFMLTFANPNQRVEDTEGGNQAVEQAVENVPAAQEEPVVAPLPAPVPVVTPIAARTEVSTSDAIDAQLALNQAKSAAISELNNYKNDYDYTNPEDYNAVIEEYTKAINDANSIDNVNSALESGKEAIDNLIEEDLKAYKEKAKEELSNYADETKLPEDVKKDIVDSHSKDIDDATTKTNVDKALENGKEAVDAAVKEQELNKAKEDAISELIAYAEDVIASEKGEEKVLDEYKDKITNAGTIDEVKEELQNGKDALDALASTEFAKYKEDAIAALKEEADDTDADKEKIAAVVTDYTEKINAVEEFEYETVDEVLAEGIAALKALADEDFAAYIAAAQEALREYAKTKKVNETTKETIVNEYVEKIGKATTKTAVDAELKNGKEALNAAEAFEAYQTKKVAELIEYAETKKISESKKSEIVEEYTNAIYATTTEAKADEALANGKEALNAAEAFEAYQAAAVTALEEHAATKTSIDDNTKETIVAEHTNNINAAENKEDVDKALENGKLALDNAEELASAKATAIAELEEHASTKKLLDEQTKASIVEEYTSKIIASATKEAISENLQAGKDALDAKELEVYKTSAITDLNTYAGKKNINSVTDKEAIVTKYTGEINDATSINDAEKALQRGLAALDAKELEDAKAYYTELLTNYNSDVKYSDYNAGLVSSYKEGGINNINSSTSVEGVVEAYNNAIAQINALDTTAPVITLNGASERTVYVRHDNSEALKRVTGDNVVNKNEFYVEEGYEVSEETVESKKSRTITFVEEGSSKPVIKNHVHYNKYGVYTITYKEEDASGNAGTATRVINVVKLDKDGITVLGNKTDSYTTGDYIDVTVYQVYNNGYKEVIPAQTCNKWGWNCKDNYSMKNPNGTYFDGNVGHSLVTGREVIFTLRDGGAKATYKFNVTKYSESDLEDMFYLEGEVYESKGKYYFEFENMPEGAKITSIQREDHNPATLIQTESANKIELSYDDYKILRHNDLILIDVTFEINGQTYTQSFHEAVGDIRVSIWDFIF